LSITKHENYQREGKTTATNQKQQTHAHAHREKRERPAHMNAYAFVIAKTHGANHRRKSSPLANRENENFYFAFRPAELVRHSSYYTSALSEILPSAPKIFPCPLALTFPFFFSFFFFFTSLINKSIIKIQNFFEITF
jgi:hypothetical protein